MYGFFLKGLAELVQHKFDEETWKDICSKARLELAGGQVFIHRKYTDKETMQLLADTATVTGITVDELLEELGQYFLDYCKESGYGRFLRALGNTLSDLLANLDIVYLHLDSFYPAMCPPSFRCTPLSNGNLLLEYRSIHKQQLCSFVVGLVKAMAMDFFQLDVDIENNTRDGDDVSAFVIKDKALLGLGSRKRSSSFVADYSQFRASSNPKTLSLKMETFSVLFPFHLILNRDLDILQAGTKIRTLTKSQFLGRSKGVKLSDVFVVQKPLILLSFSAILNNINCLFMLRPKSSTTHMDSNLSPFAAEYLYIQGQMIYVPESDTILFMGSPRSQEVNQINEVGLRLSDIPTHDVTRDLFLVTQSRRQGRELVRKLEETSSNLLQMRETLEHEKKKTDNLLYSMLPQHIAQELRLHNKVKAQRFEIVTVMCADIVQFTALCAHEGIVAMDIIRVLNKLYTKFDTLTSIHGIYKVETIGDAYITVGGLPEYCDDHAERVINMAFDMIDVCDTVTSPATKKPIQVRFGVHSGECVAGIVGQKKPRYCLFGSTITVASQVETHSLPGRINITEDTKRYLTLRTDITYEENTRKEPSRKCFLLIRSVQSLRQNVALGLPPARGMFITPNPTPPSSLEASPCESPSYQIIRSMNYFFTKSDSQCSNTSSTPPIPTIQLQQDDFDGDGQNNDICAQSLIFDFSVPVLQKSSSIDDKTKSGNAVTCFDSNQNCDACSVGKHEASNLDNKTQTECPSNDQITAGLKSDNGTLSQLSFDKVTLDSVVKGHNDGIIIKPKQIDSSGLDTKPCSEVMNAINSTEKRLSVNDGVYLDKTVKAKEPLNLLDRAVKTVSNNKISDNQIRKNAIASDKNVGESSSKGMKHKGRRSNSASSEGRQRMKALLSPCLNRPNGIVRRFSDINPHSCPDDTLVLYFRSCKSGPSSPCTE